MAPSFVRDNVRASHGYSPGEQPLPGERVVKLNTNENPFPPGPKVMQAIREIEAETLRRYPQPLADSFRETAAKVLGVDADMILAGNGSDDILTIITRAFVPPGGALACPAPTYSLYPVLAQLEEAKCIDVPWDTDWSLPIKRLVDTKANAIYLANPNAPSGTVVSPADIAALATEFDGAIIVDEAYVDFAARNCLALVGEFENIIVTRSLSKAYSLAGMRFGFCVAQPHVIHELLKVKDSYNCDAVSIIAATAAMADQEYARMTWEHVKAERSRLSSELSRLGWAVIPSEANFILAGVPGGDGRAAYLKLKEQGVLVRFFDKPGLNDKLRITIGSLQENNALLGAIGQLTTTEKAA